MTYIEFADAVEKMMNKKKSLKSILTKRQIQVIQIRQRISRKKRNPLMKNLHYRLQKRNRH